MPGLVKPEPEVVQNQQFFSTVGMIFQIFVWRSPKGRCYGNQLNMGDVRKRCVERPLPFALGFDNGLANRKFTFNPHTCGYLC